MNRDPFKDDDSLALTAYLVTDQEFSIQQGERKKDWMENSINRFAYRCLPLVIANQMGWDLLCPHSFIVIWNGGDSIHDLYIESDVQPPAVLSHFGGGVLTFHVNALFRTSPGHNLWVKGPPNHPKDGISPLEGVVETDWATATFTMNWILTRANHRVRFEEGEPFCRILPYPRHYIGAFDTRIKNIQDNPDLQQSYLKWSQGRQQFNDDLQVAGSEAQQTGWQKQYHRGQDPQGRKYEYHETKVRLNSFSKNSKAESED